MDYTIFYVGNGHTGGTPPENQTGNGDVTLSSSGSLVRTGYTFKGWNTEPDGSGTRYAELGDYDLLGDITLYAEWQPSSEQLAATGGEEVPMLPLALSLLAVGVVARIQRRRANTI
jgi:uncharacterized repeat protein (TIGR02543 family)